MRSDKGKPIAEIVREYDVTKTFLERCEQLHVLRIRRSGPHRRLERDDEERLQTILKGLRLGFTLGEMKMLFDAAARNNQV